MQEIATWVKQYSLVCKKHSGVWQCGKEKKGLFLEDLWAFDVMEAERDLGVEEKI